MQPTQDALTEYAATVTALQSEPMPITEAEYNALVAKLNADDMPLTDEQCRIMDKIKAKIKIAETQRLATIDQGVARSQDLAASKDWGVPTA
jgi:hypothetical protein